MLFTYTHNYGKISYDKFSWLTGDYDPNNMYALDDRGKKHEEYVENLESHNIWFITGWIRGDSTLFVDNYGNVWVQETVYSNERGLHLTRCPYKKRDYEQSTIQLPDQVIQKILEKEWTITPVNTTRDILAQFEALEQDIEDERSGLKEFIQILGGSPAQNVEFRKSMALLRSGKLAYELIPPIDPPTKTVPQSTLGNRYIIGNPKHYIVIDNTGQVWSLGKGQMVPSSFDGAFIQYVGDTPMRHGDRYKYPLPTILQPFVSNIIAYSPQHNKWGAAGDTVDPSAYTMSHLQPVAKYLFDTFASDVLKQDHLEYEQEIVRNEEARRKAEEDAQQAIIAEEARRIEEAARLKAEEQEAADKKLVAQEFKAKQILQAQIELLDAQKRLNELINQQ